MTDLSPEAAALLEAARRSHGPEERDRERVLSSLHLSLGIAVPLALTASAAEAAVHGASELASQSVLQSGVQTSLQTGLQTGVAQTVTQGAVVSGKSALSLGAKLLTWKAGKIFLATVALGSAVGVTAVQRATRVEDETSEVRSTRAIARGRAVEDADRTRTMAAPAVLPAMPEAQATAVPALAVVPEAAPTVPAPAASDVRTQPAPAVEKTTAHRVRHGSRAVMSHRARVAARRASLRAEAPPDAPSSAPTAPVVVEPATETELIRKVLTSLRDRDAERALALLDEHAARFPGGAFATERRGLHVVALCAAGRTSEGKREQKAFLEQNGKAPIAARVRSACGESNKP